MNHPGFLKKREDIKDFLDMLIVAGIIEGEYRILKNLDVNIIGGFHIGYKQYEDRVTNRMVCLDRESGKYSFPNELRTINLKKYSDYIDFSGQLVYLPFQIRHVTRGSFTFCGKVSGGKSDGGPRSLIGFPKKIDKDLVIRHAYDFGDDLEDIPTEYVGGDIIINYTGIKTLKGFPDVVGGDTIDLMNNQITDYKGFPNNWKVDILYRKSNGKYYPTQNNTLFVNLFDFGGYYLEDLINIVKGLPQYVIKHMIDKEILFGKYGSYGEIYTLNPSQTNVYDKIKEIISEELIDV